MCNCKQAPTIQRPNVVRVNNTVEIQNPITPLFTQEDLTRVKDYLISRNQTAAEKNWVIDFHNQHFEEKFPHGYNGDGWIRIKKRIDHLQTTMNDYIQLKNN